MAEYIEREAALHSLTPIVKRASERNRNIYSAVKQCVEAINWCPSADVQPVRHGRWIKKHDDVCYWHECSECGIKPPKDQWKNEWKSPYCHNCGAKMDGGET